MRTAVLGYLGKSLDAIGCSILPGLNFLRESPVSDPQATKAPWDAYKPSQSAIKTPAETIDPCNSSFS